jgi:hypothetical protein
MRTIARSLLSAVVVAQLALAVGAAVRGLVAVAELQRTGHTASAASASAGAEAVDATTALTAVRASVAAGVGAVAGWQHEAPVAAPRIVWASTDYGIREPEQAVIELQIIVDNPALSPTESTSILWEPAFADAFVLLDSDPLPWRVRRDEHGWGSLDTSGVLPAQHGRYRLWFATAASVSGAAGATDATGAAVSRGGAGEQPAIGLGVPLAVDAAHERGPLVKVVANGTFTMGEVHAQPLHAIERRRHEWQWQFERGSPAALADRATVVPTDRRGAFRAGVGLAMVLVFVVFLGGATAFARAPRTAPALE